MAISKDIITNTEFQNLYIEEKNNSYRECIQGLANEPITVRSILRRAENLLQGESGFLGLGDYSLPAIVRRLAANRPRVCIIQGSPDHPAHLFDHEHALRAVARIWQNGGVPFTFGIPVICDGTAQSNIGQCYSLASRNHSAMAVNINFEGHGYHAAYVIAGCDKTPSGILCGLAAAARVRRIPERGNAPVWAIFAPAHVLRGGNIPADTRRLLQKIQDRVRAVGDAQLADDIEENCHYILQCTSDEAFLGLLNRVADRGLCTREEAHEILDELAVATCHEKGGICAFNGTGNSSRTILSALGLVPSEVELLTDEASTDVVFRNVDHLFRLFNQKEYAVCELLKQNYANAIRIHSATGCSTNLMLHMPAIMRYAGFDVTIHDYETTRRSSWIPDIFAHSLTEGRDTFVLAQQMQAFQNRGMESIYRVLFNLGIPMDLDAKTVLHLSWRDRIENLTEPVSKKLAPEKSVIRMVPVREMSGTEVLYGNFHSSCTIKVAGMSTEQYKRFDGRIFVVRYYENENDCNNELNSANLLETLAKIQVPEKEILRRICLINGKSYDNDPLALIRNGSLAFAFVIAGQGPEAFGMPEMFAPSQYLRHHGILEQTSILLTDGRYSGVTKGACVGHTTPEAWNDGGIGLMNHGDLLWMRLSERRLDWLDAMAFANGDTKPFERLPYVERGELAKQRKARMEKRRMQIAACNLLDHVSDAEHGVVPEAVDGRAILHWHN